MKHELPSGWQTSKHAWPHPSADFLACRLGKMQSDRGVGIFRRDGELVSYIPGAYHFLWLAGGERGLSLTYPGQTVARHLAPDWTVDRELSIPTTRSGCAAEELAGSRSGRWAVTQRFSGQGECGFDVIDVDTMERVGGVAEVAGYTLDLPAFAADESFLVASITPTLGGFWSHPEDDLEEPARGGVVELARICVHRLPGHEASWHRLEVEVPKGFLPEDPWDEQWYGPDEVEPFEQGVCMRMPGGSRFEHPGPLPPVLRVDWFL